MLNVSFVFQMYGCDLCACPSSPGHVKYFCQVKKPAHLLGTWPEVIRLRLYVEQTGPTMEPRSKGHAIHDSLCQGKSALVEHSIKSGHQINFKETLVLARIVWTLVMNATEIQIHPNNFNRVVDFILNKSRNQLLIHLTNPDPFDIQVKRHSGGPLQDRWPITVTQTSP
jgi:hypothetical protein